MAELINKRVLVFSEDRSVKNFLSEFFFLNKFETSSADNVKELMRFLRKRKYDLLVIDLDMKNLEGLELIKRIRDEDILFPIICTGTAYSVVELSKLGPTYFLQKPFVLDHLKSKLKIIFK
jgi:two-component system response regulator PhoP